MASDAQRSGHTQPLSLTRAGQTHAWVARFADRLLITDVVFIVFAVALAQVVRFVLLDGALVSLPGEWGADVDPTWVSVFIVLTWLAALSAFGSRDARVLGTGSTEYKRVVQATVTVFGLIALVAYVSRFDLARGYVAMALPLGLIGLLISRWAWRRWLTRMRVRGFFLNRVVVVGSQTTTTHIVKQLGRAPSAGMRVLGVCIPNGVHGSVLPGTRVPVLGTVEDAIHAMQEAGAETLVLTSSDELPPQRIRELSWQLEPNRQHLIVAPTLTDVGGPRIHTRPVAGLPLIHVETPRFEGSKRFMKRMFDLVASGALIAVLALPMVAIAVAVKLDSPGSVLFRQERVGFRGQPFRMLKFRSMQVDAESRLSSLLDQRDSNDDPGNAVLFKMKADPRITRVGGVLRRFSLDELPQLFNVFAGDMALVGPRPPLQREVDQYEQHVHRKFLVKPGITGLWQVSGRSNLTWEESVRLDLYYVENWSLMTDLQILWRTFRAVVSRDGAY